MPERKKKRKIEDTDAWMAADFDYIDMVSTNRMPLLRGPIVGEEKIEWLEGIVEECPEYYPALFDLASENIKNGNDEAGKRCTDRGLQSLRAHFSRNDLIDAYHKTGEFLEYYLRFELALEYYNQLLKITKAKEKQSVYDSIALCYACLNDIDKAIEYQRRAIESNENCKFYKFLSKHKLVEKAEFKELEKEMKNLKPELMEKMLRYNEVRHNDDYTEEEKENVREELFEGDHAWPIL